MNKYKLKRDESSHWYLIPLEEEEEHFNKCYRAIVDSDFDDNNLINEFEYLYKKHRISNPYDLIIILED